MRDHGHWPTWARELSSISIIDYVILSDAPHGLNVINNSGIDMAELLIPDLNFNIEKDNYMELLTHEGYQLKWK